MGARGAMAPPYKPISGRRKIVATAHQAKMHQIRFRLGLRPRPYLQIGFLNILDMILSRVLGSLPLELGPRWGHRRRLNGAR